MAAHASVTGVLDAFDVVRAQAAVAKGTAAGRMRSDQVDLLRAAMVFTSSGLDATCQRLVRDAAPALIARGGKAKTLFDKYVSDLLHEPKPPAGLVEAMTGPDPRLALVSRYVSSKTAASFQGSSDLRGRVRDLLGITNTALPAARFITLDAFFQARNDIVHQLDYEDPSGARIARNRRAPAVVVVSCDDVMLIAADLIRGTAALLR